MSRSWRVVRLFACVVVPTLALFLPASAAAVYDWGTPVQISSAGGNATKPQVATSPTGTAIAVWSRDDGSNLRVQAAVRPPAGNWGAPQTLSDPGQDGFDANVAIDGSGNAIVVWARFSDPTLSRIQGSWRPVATGVFGPVQNISALPPPPVPPQPPNTETGINNSPDVSIDAQGNATVVWLAQLNAGFRIAASQSPSLGTFSPQHSISDSGRDAFEPQVDSEANGGATAVWTRSDGAFDRVESVDRRNITVPYEVPLSGPDVYVTLVPVFKQCGTGSNPATGAHSPPLSAGACNVTGVTGFAHVGNQSLGEARWSSRTGDVRYSASITDVRSTTTVGPDYNPNPTGPDMGLDARFRLTNLNTCSGVGCTGPYDQAGSTTDITFPIPVDCVDTSDPSIGATCTVDTSANALSPGMFRPSKFGVLTLFRIIVRDSGPNGIRGDGDDKGFEHQGFYVP